MFRQIFTALLTCQTVTGYDRRWANFLFDEFVSILKVEFEILGRIESVGPNKQPSAIEMLSTKRKTYFE